jgi:hypothetical protein
MPMSNAPRAAAILACVLLLAGCTMSPPVAEQQTSATPAASSSPSPSAPAAGGPTPSISPTAEPTVEGFEFVTVDPDEYALAPVEQSTKLVVAWAEQYCELAGLTPCTGIADRGVRLCIEKWDCHPALLVAFDEGTAAFVSGGIFPEARVFAVWRDESHPDVEPFGGARKLLEAYLLSVGVCPDGGGGNPRGVGCPTI